MADAIGFSGSNLSALPTKASNPFPANNATGVTTNQLRWGKVNDATNGYLVYFPTSNTLAATYTTNSTTNYYATCCAGHIHVARGYDERHRIHAGRWVDLHGQSAE